MAGTDDSPDRLKLLRGRLLVLAIVVPLYLFVGSRVLGWTVALVTSVPMALTLWRASLPGRRVRRPLSFTER